MTPRDGDSWRAWLKAPLPKGAKRRTTNSAGAAPRAHVAGEGKGLGENTIRRWCGRAKQFFRAAIRARLIADNPFADQKVAVQANKARLFFITREVAEKVLETCFKLPNGNPRPNAVQWRLVFALARYGGLRCPSEFLPLRWGDVNWELGRIRVRSPKTEHHDGHGERWVPLFPELRPFLTAAYAAACIAAGLPDQTTGTGLQEGGEFVPAIMHTKAVVTICGEAGANLRTHFQRIIEQAGVTPWPKLFQNLRSTRETELAESFPLHVVTAWLGNSQPVALKQYLQVTDEHFARALEPAEDDAEALQKPLQSW